MRHMVAVAVLVVSLVVSVPVAAAQGAPTSLWDLWSTWWSQAVGSLLAPAGSPGSGSSGFVAAAGTVEEEPPPEGDGDVSLLLLVEPDGSPDGNECSAYPEFDPNG